MVEFNIISNSPLPVIATACAQINSESFLVAVSTPTHIIVTVFGIMTHTLEMADTVSLSMSNEVLAIISEHKLYRIPVTILMT